jgi:hypothetical protein
MIVGGLVPPQALPWGACDNLEVHQARIYGRIAIIARCKTEHDFNLILRL